jgi:signal transduction histidine kinase
VVWRRAVRDPCRVHQSVLDTRETVSTSTEDQLADHAARLARKIEALDDFAGLVAHDVRSSLLAALRGEDTHGGLIRALELVDSILEAVRTDLAEPGTARVGDCVNQAISDLGEAVPEILGNASGEFPIPAPALRIVLRNLLGNAVAAGADHIHVSALARGDLRLLVVDDDGLGIASTTQYATGTQLGLRLCRRLVERRDGALELRPRSVGGTRAVITATGAGT